MIRNLRLICFLAGEDFKKKFTESFLGIFWVFLQPCVCVFLYYLVFQQGFHTEKVASIPYVPWLVCGIIPWFWFSDALSSGVVSVTAYRNWVRKLVFPAETIPAMRMVSSFYVHAIYLGVMILTLEWYGYVFQWRWIQILYYEICEWVLLSGLISLCAAIQVFAKDMAQMINVCLQMGFWMAPIMYQEEQMPGSLRQICQGNPVTYLIRGFRETFLLEGYFWETPLDLVLFWIKAGSIYVTGRWVFKKLKDQFPDVL